MIRLNNVSLPLDYEDKPLKYYAAKALKISVTNIKSASLFKRSVDARRKNQLHFEAALDITLFQGEEKIASKNPNVRITEPYRYDIPVCKKLEKRPVIIGSGPCGLFAGLILAQAGQMPIILERGRDVDSRTADVSHFWTGGILDTVSNVQFGEGGAGTFSDGKLNTGTKDKRIRKVLEEFVLHGAPEDILYLAKPHIGTDKLKITVKNIRNEIIKSGGEVIFEARFTGIKQSEGRLTAVVYEKDNTQHVIPADNAVLAIGHSARDTFSMLKETGIKMEQKAFSMGVRIEHLQESIDRQQYGSFAGHKALKAADYKLAVHPKTGRGVYTFCMCPGGMVVAAASEKGRLAVNGMSEYARDGINANSAVLVSIGTEDFGSSDVLAGIFMQRMIEEKAFIASGENYHAPVQRVGDFINGNKTTGFGSVIPSYRPGVEMTDLSSLLPEFMTESLKEGLMLMDGRLKGFADNDAVLTAVESRSSSPVRILRDDTMQSVTLRGLYPCGEGAGYAGGIMSAAVDGIKAAEKICLKQQNILQ